jgi:hypothetical protein
MKTIRYASLLFMFSVLVTISCPAADYICYPTGEALSTGFTDYSVTTGGDVLTRGGPTTGPTRKENGFFKFDVSAVPDSTAVMSVVLYFHVNDTNYPWWFLTPLTSDPTTTPADTLWDEIETETSFGGYNFRSESASYTPGWHSFLLGGMAAEDLTTILSIGQDWFALGTAGWDALPDYFVSMDGFAGPAVPYIVVSDDPEHPCFDEVIDLGPMSCQDVLSHAGTTVSATDFCANLSGDAFFSFEVLSASTYEISTCYAGTDFDTYLRLKDDACCGNEIATSDDAGDGCGETSRITIPLTPGIYYVHVEGAGSREGNYELHISCGATVSCSYTCTPSIGTVPFASQMTTALTNVYTGQTRRLAARIDVVFAGGQFISNWRSGYSNVAVGESQTTSWNQSIPALASVIGDNVFSLLAQDVTPAPYNQPPYPPAGDTDTSDCTVTGVAP